MSFSTGGTTVTQQATPEQRAQMAATTGFLTNTIIPQYQQYSQGAQDIYNQNAPGINAAAQNLFGTAMQGQNVLGSTGESALRTGVSGLENLFNPQYEQNQINAAMAAPQAQYQQNLAQQQNQFGGAGELGSARSVLAGQQLAGMNQFNQTQAAATIENQIAQQRLAAGQSLAGIGSGGINQAIGAAGQGVNAAGVPMNTYAQLGQLYGFINPTSYTPNFSGTQGSTINKSAISIAPSFS